MLRSLDQTSPFSPITSLQPPQFQELTNSFAQRPFVNLLIINDFRTLSVVIGVVPCSPREANQIFLSPLESAVTRIKPSKSFRIRTYEKHRGRGYGPGSRNEKIRRATMNAAKYSCFCWIAPQPKGSSPRSSATQFTGSFNGTKPIWRPGRGATLGSAAPTSIGGAGAAKTAARTTARDSARRSPDQAFHLAAQGHL